MAGVIVYPRQTHLVVATTRDYRMQQRVVVCRGFHRADLHTNSPHGDRTHTAPSSFFQFSSRRDHSPSTYHRSRKDSVRLRSSDPAVAVQIDGRCLCHTRVGTFASCNRNQSKVGGENCDISRLGLPSLLDISFRLCLRRWQLEWR